MLRRTAGIVFSVEYGWFRVCKNRRCGLCRQRLSQPDAVSRFRSIDSERHCSRIARGWDAMPPGLRSTDYQDVESAEVLPTHRAQIHRRQSYRPQIYRPQN